MESRLNCPFCKTLMNKIKKADVIIDRCPNCLGIWLEKGELNKIIEKRKKQYQDTGEAPPSTDDIELLVGGWD